MTELSVIDCNDIDDAYIEGAGKDLKENHNKIHKDAKSSLEDRVVAYYGALYDLIANRQACGVVGAHIIGTRVQMLASILLGQDGKYMLAYNNGTYVKLARCILLEALCLLKIPAATPIHDYVKSAMSGKPDTGYVCGAGVDCTGLALAITGKTMDRDMFTSLAIDYMRALLHTKVGKAMDVERMNVAEGIIIDIIAYRDEKKKIVKDRPKKVVVRVKRASAGDKESFSTSSDAGDSTTKAAQPDLPAGTDAPSIALYERAAQFRDENEKLCNALTMLPDVPGLEEGVEANMVKSGIGLEGTELTQFCDMIRLTDDEFEAVHDVITKASMTWLEAMFDGVKV